MNYSTIKSAKNILPVLLFVLITILIFLLPFNYLLHFSLDDSFFYIKTAYNFASGFGSTFDTVNKTNGYHPLWFLFLSVYYYIIKLFISASPELIYRFTFLAAALINLATLKCLSEVYKSIFNKEDLGTVFLFSVILLLPLVLFNIIGLETQLSVFLILLYIYHLINRKDNLLSREIILSLLLLTRIDYTAFLLPAFLIIEWKFSQKEINIKGILKFIGIPLTVIILYLISNKIFWGHYFPISAVIKASFNWGNILNNFPTPSGDPITFIIICFNILSAMVYFFFIRRKIRGSNLVQYFISFEVLFYAGAIFLLTQFIFSRNGAGLWYYSIVTFSSVLLISPIVVFYKKMKICVLTGSVFVLILYFTLFRINYYRWDDSYNYALKIKDIIPPDKKIFQVDITGITGFFSERKVINGDGLINSFEYRDFIKDKKLSQYLMKYNIEYYSTYSYENPVTNEEFYDSHYHPGDYEFRFPQKNIVLTMPKFYGGIFRQKIGNFYLVKF